mmetsp:Transcript_29225/g.56453  ORF Transcript_29225/g.56453 Transcript_29225/m.56453 type:complete len:498 (+) Transcript_29225:137-1630(+)
MSSPPTSDDIVQQRSVELSKAREQLGLVTQPIRTCRLFAAAVSKFMHETAWAFAVSKPLLLFGYPFFALFVATRIYMSELYAPPACVQIADTGGPLYKLELALFEAVWWLVLGILSSIGFGSGLHSGIMFLWPFVMQVVINAEAKGTTKFYAVYNHPCLYQAWGTHNDGSLTFLNQLILVWPSVILWGAGTAIGELPPYFITRAARRAGRRDDAFEAELEEAKGKSDVLSRLKVWTIAFTERNGFLGIFLLASWPNAAFDMCGMACGWLEMPFWTFFGATLLGKSLVKTTVQSAVCIGVFSKTFFEVISAALDAVDVFGFGLGRRATSLRQTVMYKFELQARFTSSDLLRQHSSLDVTAIAKKYCEVASRKCGEMNKKHEYSVSHAFEEAKLAAARIVHFWDKPSAHTGKPDGKLDAAELKLAESATDGKLSLASLDPGSASSVFSLSTAWNLFLAALVLFFALSIVEQLAKAEQAERDNAELDALAAQRDKQRKVE